MLRVALRSFWLCACVLGAGAAAAANLAIMPVAVHLDRVHDRTTVHVTNHGDTPTLLQADAVAWRREGGVDSDAASDDLIVNPGVFVLQPGRTQVVRVGLRRGMAAEREMTYRIVLREVPTALESPAGPGNVRVLVTLRVPVYVAPATVRAEPRWHARYDEQGALVAQVSNEGNVHYRINAVRLLGAGADARLIPQGAQSVLFPGEQRSFRLPHVAHARTEPLKLEVTTDRGIQHVALEATPR